MKQLTLALVTILFLTASYRLQSQNEGHETVNVLDYVDPFIGTDFHGHTYPGATVPNGMVQLSPDTRVNGWDACSGYHYSDATIMGFSHTHLSGTGIGDLGDVMLMPFTGEVPIIRGDENNPDGFKSAFQKENEEASPGYYSVYLDDFQVKAELTATTRAGFHKYIFDKGADAGIILDLQHTVHNRKVTHAEINFISDTEISGMKRNSGWAKNRFTYFYAKFSKPFSYEVYSDDKLVKGVDKATGTNLKAKLFLNVKDGESVLAKVGISAVDIEGAKKNLESEITNWNFDGVHAAARAAWESELSKISVKSDVEADKTVFYTSLYHANLSPIIYSDVDGRYRGMDKEIHSAETPNYTIFSLWDTYRALHPLFTIIKPTYNQELIRSLLRKHQEGGVMPMWELASNYTGTMIGSHSVSVVADAYMKGNRDFDNKLALDAMIQAVNYDTMAAPDYVSGGRSSNLKTPAKKLIDEYGYVPSDKIYVSVAKALEFAYNYWCIARVAEDMGEVAIADEYYKKSKTYAVYFDKKTQFMRGKTSEGGWTEPFDPYNSDHWKTDYVEGNAWQWIWYVPHDVDGLIDLFGNKKAFAKRLDDLFDAPEQLTGDHVPGDITGLIGQYVHGNEPSHHIAYLYNYADQPWKTQEKVAQIVSEFYTDEPDGLTGNEDCGQMSAWYLLNSMGFYPVAPGETRYSVGTPLFDEVKVKLENGNTFTVKRINGGGDNMYVKSVTIDGVPLEGPFIEHAEIMAGKTLEFVMGSKPGIFWK